MLPDTPDSDGIIQVNRHVGGDEDDVLDALTDFIASQDLEPDRSDGGPGTLFRPRPDPQTQGPWFFGDKDSLRVVVTPDASGTTVQFTADMRGMHARGDNWKQGRYIRGSLLSLFFIGLGVQGLFQNGVSTGDFVPMGIGAWLGMRAVRRARGESDSREEIERKLANALERTCDEMER